MANMDRLFRMQKVLDDRIVKEHGLEGQNLLPGTILALQVELGELANEWQGFKHWKVDPQPKPKMLEEYVDCLHFILSIGNDLEVSPKIETLMINETVTDCFLDLFEHSSKLDLSDYHSDYDYLFSRFIELGELLGFTWEQIEQAYFEKNKINHARQDGGY